MKKLLTFAIGAMALAAVALPATAAARDRNHDKIPDKWEKKFNLSLKVNQAHRNQDRDGLDNRQEFVAGDNPRKADSNNDGTDDAQEGAGTVTSFAGGKLTITLFNGEVVAATFNDQTELKCEPSPVQATGSAAKAADDGPRGDQGDDDQGENENEGNCGPDALQAQTIVKEAELRLTSGGAVFEEIKLGGKAPA